MQQHVRQTPTYVIEVFHVRNPATGQEMTIELWFGSLSQVGRFGSFQVYVPAKKGGFRRVKVYAGRAPIVSRLRYQAHRRSVANFSPNSCWRPTDFWTATHST
ncbi:hypothetical protein AAVH_25709 [Aphelenchoides avenae]|nr:hypothetical protein AAVH_25709 [Aphelenchus avenae]